jgi:ubiquinone/menaquinone biosynthesis C-methylase UbiE
MNAISSNYRELRPDEVPEVAAMCAEAWKDPRIPMRQYESAARKELEAFRRGEGCRPYDVLIDCLRHIPTWDRPRVLDVGASGGYYSEILKVAGFDARYTGLDFSPAFQQLARNLYPAIDFDLGDAAALPYRDDWYDVVLHGAVIMHSLQYPSVIGEASRVSRQYVVFHRTPILRDKPTSYFLKEGYGIPMLEIHFNEGELLDLFQSHGLKVVYSAKVFWDGTFGHWDYLLEKSAGLNHVQV